MWFVEGIWNWNTGEKERYEGLTEEQSRAKKQLCLQLQSLKIFQHKLVFTI